ncbi:MAG: hypothetical protein EBY93_07330 [Actinobacteria bacterium]|nr:hypothetical protein [Actinomycetota bacterium]
MSLQDILTRWQSDFNLLKGPIYSVGYLYGYSDGSSRIYFALHHLIVDTVSWRILIEDLKTLYEKSPASLGMMCVAHLVVKEESTAREALDVLNAGEKFSAVAAKYSIEPGADKSGGVLGSADGDCIPLSDYQTQFDKDFVAGALNAKAGVPTGPVKSSFGYHVIYVRPFDDVKLSVKTLIATNPGEFLINGYMATADVKIGSKYGRYNPATGTIVAN